MTPYIFAFDTPVLSCLTYAYARMQNGSFWSKIFRDVKLNTFQDLLCLYSYFTNQTGNFTLKKKQAKFTWQDLYPIKTSLAATNNIPVLCYLNSNISLSIIFLEVKLG